MNFEEFIKPELLILIPVLYIVGLGIKKSKLPDNFIPLIFGGISVVLSSAWVIATSDISTLKDVAYVMFISVTQGILSAGASVYINQIYVQSKKKE
ncbi:MAG: phage holin family protein [Clostridia bacterium]|nr:phage holin family protein [Clostridia bacterium]